MITFNSLGQHGRLGNQMFQYALIYSVAKKNKFEFGVPYKNKSEDEFKNFSIPDGFKITAQDSSNFTNKFTFKEKKFSFDKDVFDCKDNTNFKGFFQSYKYFEEFKKEIHEQFTFNDKIIEKSEKIISKYKEPTISICLRRGNYLKFPRIHPTCKYEYFAKCLRRLPDLKKLIITDDENCNFLKKIKNAEIIKQTNDKDNKFVMLRIMSKCEYHILSNSTFCWWGAWLSESKKVFAIKNWFGPDWYKYWLRDPDPHWMDIYCKNWNIIEAPKIF